MKIKFRINSEKRTIVLSGIKMNQNRFSYNSITFAKVSDDTIEVYYQKQIVEDSQDNKDLGLSWAISDCLNVIEEYSKPSTNPYNKGYKMFERII